MAFSLTPKLTILLLLLILSMFAFSAEAAYSGHGKQKTIRLSGFFPVVFTNETFIFIYDRITALPDRNSAVKAIYRSARLRTLPNVYSDIAHYSNVTDDSGYHYNGTFTLVGQTWNRNMSVGQLVMAQTSGTGDFYNAAGSAYIRRFSKTLWHANIEILSGLIN